MPRRDRATLLWLWFCLGLLPLFLRPLWEPDEARYAEIPREMLAAGDWLTPKLNGLLYFEKPPLQYWLSAAALKLFGLQAWAARLPLALAAGLMLWATWRLARRLGAREPRWAPFMAVTALLPFVVGQLLTLDALFSALLVAGLAAFLEAVAARSAERDARGWTLLAFGLFACALLTKGLAQLILVGGGLVLSLPFGWRDRKLRRAILRTAFDPLGWILYLVLAAPWFVLVERANPGHARFFFIHEHFTRFLTHEHARQGSDNWLLDKLYFAGILALGLLPWLSSALRGAWRAWAFARRGGPQGPELALHRWTVAAVLASAAWPLVFFSLSGSKLPPYILPVFPPLLALAVAFERQGEELAALRRTGRELVALGLVFAAAGLVARKDAGDLALWALLPAAGFLLLGLWALRPRGIGLGSAAWMTALGACLWMLVLAAHRAAGPDKDVGPLVRAAPAHAQWISYGVYFQALPFHTGERCVVVAGTGELGFGRGRLGAAEAEAWLPEGRDALLPTARRLQAEHPGRALRILMKDRDWADLDEATKAALRQVQVRGNNVVATLR